MKKITFKKPETLVIPDGVSTNGEFEALATLKVEDDGQLCLVAIDDNRMDGYDDKEGSASEPKEDSATPDSMTYAQAASEGMM